MTLPYLFTPVTIKKTRKGGVWRPTRSEMQESFFLHISVSYENSICNLHSAIDIIVISFIYILMTFNVYDLERLQKIMFIVN